MAGPELWTRVETRGEDTGFHWMVWRDETGVDEVKWFESEREAREYLTRSAPARASWRSLPGALTKEPDPAPETREETEA